MNNINCEAVKRFKVVKAPPSSNSSILIYNNPFIARHCPASQLWPLFPSDLFAGKLSQISFAKPTQPLLLLLHPRLSESNKKIPFNPLTRPNLTRVTKTRRRPLRRVPRFPFYRELNKPRPDQSPYINPSVAALNKNRRVVLFLSFFLS